jgi:multidrug resistance efflux pump
VSGFPEKASSDRVLAESAGSNIEILQPRPARQAAAEALEGTRLPGGTATPQDARALHSALHKVYVDTPATPDAEPAPARGFRPALAHWFARPDVRRAAKSALALVLVVLLGWKPVNRLLERSSVEAVVNSQLITLRSPIDGEVSFLGAMGAPRGLHAEQTPLVRIKNTRVDPTRVDDVRRELRRAERARAALTVRLSVMERQLAEATDQTERFRSARMRQLDARLAEIDQEEKAASARLTEASAALERSFVLVGKGHRTASGHDLAKRDAAVSKADLGRARKRREAVAVELESLRAGYFFGDSYNDRPRSLDRADDLAAQVGALRAELEVVTRSTTDLEAALGAEEARHAALAEARLVAPVASRIWEVMTAPGEHVRQGQEVLKLLDCTSAAVSATVSEGIFNRLEIGTPVRFQHKEGGQILEGTVSHLAGQAAVRANYAIAPSLLHREMYRVTATIPGLATDGNCHPGRTGRIVFGS